MFSKSRLVLVLAVGVFWIQGFSALVAQEADILDHLRNGFGRDRNASWFEASMVVLNDQIEHKHLRIQSAKGRQQKLQVELHKVETELDMLQSEQPEGLQLASPKIHEELTGRCLQTLLDTRLEIAANEAYLAKTAQIQEPIEATMHSYGQRIAENRLELFERKFAQVSKLVEQGAANMLQQLEAKLELQEAEAKLAEHLALKKAYAELGPSGTSDEASQMQLNNVRLRALEAAAMNELRKLGDARKLARQVRQFEHLATEVSQKLELYQRHVAELELELDDLMNLKVMCEAVRRSPSEDE